MIVIVIILCNRSLIYIYFLPDTYLSLSLLIIYIRLYNINLLLYATTMTTNDTRCIVTKLNNNNISLRPTEPTEKMQ